MPPEPTASITHDCRKVPRKQFVDVALLVACNDGAECCGQPGVGIDAVELAGFDQRGDDGPVLGTGIMTGKERVLPVQCDGTDGPLDSIVVELNASPSGAFGETRLRW